MKRRDFVKFLGVTPGALAGSGSLADAQERLFENLLRPKQQDPADMWVVHQTTCTECPAGCGVLVKGREGRPVKLEGDPDHPINRGGLCMRGQASLGRLYHQERLREPLARGADGSWEPISWNAALDRISNALVESRGGSRNVYLSSRTTGSLAQLLDEFAASLNVERLPDLELFSYGALREAYDVLFGRREVPAYHVEEADLLVTVGADLFESFISPVRFARHVSEGLEHHLDWYHLEPQLTMTGTNAGHRIHLHAGSEQWLLAYLLKSAQPRSPLPARVLDAVPDVTIEQAFARTGVTPEQLQGLVAAWDAAEHPLVIAGGVSTAHAGGLPTALLAGLLQESSGAIGNLVDFGEAENYDSVGTPGELVDRVVDLASANVGVCFLSRLHTLAPVAGLQEVAGSAVLTVGLTDFLYPPTEACDLLLPISHSLESWGDVETYRGLTSVVRPAFTPLFDTVAEGDILLHLMAAPGNWEDYVATQWQAAGADVEEQPFLERPTRPVSTRLRAAPTADRLASSWTPDTLEEPVLAFSPSVRFFDGRSQVISLLNEIPDPLTAVSYGGALSISEDDAMMQSVEEGHVVQVSALGSEDFFPVRVHPAFDFAVLSLGMEHAATAALPIDANTGELIRCIGGVELGRVRDSAVLTVLSGSMDASGRGVLPNDVHHPPGVEAHEPGHEPRRLYPTPEHETYRWAMAIDLDKCTGCSACVAACYVENNISIAGPDEHRKGREMSWIRIQPYLDGDRPIEFMPVMCQQCGNAPCETVCPVYATYHNPDGLNAQVYNRCVGTRYCANNCPYKARRFNWFAGQRPEPMDLLVNPDVSVRPKGVMEKCTFCVQRIREAKDHAKDEDRIVLDGEFTTACAQSCPSGAIVFGNLLDENSEVYRWAHSENVHRILEGLGTEPAVYYLRQDNRGDTGHE
jgi:molybdopterin-containing oxidoreductase family iron-sulfur binding subunit